MSNIHDMVVDDAHGLVYLSGTPVDGTPDVVDVITADGTQVATIPVPGADQLALSPDGSTWPCPLLTAA